MSRPLGKEKVKRKKAKPETVGSRVSGLGMATALTPWARKR
jgi:hypothetical protein